jgi:hypothetical protein
MKKKYADMDPIEEIRAIREELSRKFPTVEALCEYLWRKYPSSVSPPQSPHNGRRTSPKAKANARPSLRQRKSAAHT